MRGVARIISEKERRKANRKMSTSNAPIRGLIGKIIKNQPKRRILGKSQEVEMLGSQTSYSPQTLEDHTSDSIFGK
jgi:hypothetical protein